MNTTGRTRINKSEIIGISFVQARITDSTFNLICSGIFKEKLMKWIKLPRFVAFPRQCPLIKYC